MSANFRSRLAGGETLLAPMVTLTSASTAEILADVGFDWLFLDAEHGPFETRDLQAVLQTVGDRLPCLVRVPSADEVWIKRSLDLGAAGIIAPQVNTAEQARAIVSFARYSPEGTRGVGLARAHGYGLRFQEYVETANRDVVVVVQAEHADAVNNIEEIAAVPGIDAVLIGPYDLSASLGKMGQVDDPAVTGAIDRVTETCRSANIPLGIFGVTAEAVRPYLSRGYTLIVAGVDTLMLAAQAKRIVAELSPRQHDDPKMSE